MIPNSRRPSSDAISLSSTAILATYTGGTEFHCEEYGLLTAGIVTVAGGVVTTFTFKLQGKYHQSGAWIDLLSQEVGNAAAPALEHTSTGGSVALQTAEHSGALSVRIAAKADIQGGAGDTFVGSFCAAGA